jgi:hypothetical protein
MQTSFNKGLWSQKLQNRFDIEFYRSACSHLENFDILPQGGITRRRGSVYLLECYDSSKKSVLIPLQLDKDTLFVIEFSGNQKMRIMQYDPATHTLTVKQDNHTTGFTDAELDEIHWIQINKKLYITHKNHAPRKLSRITDTTWLWSEIAHYPAAQRNNQYTFSGQGLYLASTSGAYVYFRFGLSPKEYKLFNGEKGRFFVARNDKGMYGYAVILSVGDESGGLYHHGYVNIIEPFNTGHLESDEYYLQGNGDDKLDPNEYGPEGKHITITAETEGSDNLFRTEDVGRYIEMNDGFVKISTYQSAHTITAIILKNLADKEPTRNWTMAQPEWNITNRHPKTIAFYENRLFYGGTIEKVGNVWGSRSQFYNDFTSHADDEYMLQYLLCSSTLHEILWMVGTQVLVIGTTNGIWTIGREDTSAVLTPTTPMLGYQSTLSCAGIRPVTIGNIIFFAQRNRKILRSFVATSSINVDKVTPVDETLFADPFVSSNIYQVAAQSNPHIVIWTTNVAGELWGLNYIQEQQVNSWFKFKTDGLYESLMIYPRESSGDLLWTTVKRTINSVTKRYIECFSDTSNFDSTKQFTAGGATHTLTGYVHLRDEKVWVYTEEQGFLRNSDETAHEFTVTAGGNIDITGWTATVDAWAGLPYTSEAKTMNWFGGPSDFSYEKLHRLTKLQVTALDIVNGEVGIQVEEGTTPEYVKILDTIPASAWTGIKEVGVHPGTGRIMKLCVRQTQPDAITITGLGCNLK